MGLSPEFLNKDARQTCDLCLAKNARHSHVGPRSLGRQKRAARDDRANYPRESPLHVKYRYGNFYNCPVEEKGISVRVGASASALACWRSSAGRASDL